MRDRAFRRFQTRKAKRRAWNLRVNIWCWGPDDEPDPHWVGIMASTHCQPCSCRGCGNQRKWEGPSYQERRTFQPDWSVADMRPPGYRDRPPRRKSEAKRKRAKAMSEACRLDKDARQERIWKELRKVMKSG